MSEPMLIKGFSRMSRDKKVVWLEGLLADPALSPFLSKFRIPDAGIQEKFESFSENTLSNFHLPWGIVPNVLIDDQLFHVPVVIEESSVVAAASKTAAFWAARGGFKTMEISTVKKGQLHFLFHGDHGSLEKNWEMIASELLNTVNHLTENMTRRGGGITGLALKTNPELSPNYFLLDLEAETADSMGANFINSVLEELGRQLPELILRYAGNGETEIIMAILSNYTPQSRVKMKVEAPVDSLIWNKDTAPGDFARRMKWAADIAWHDSARAVTHNKGIYNGVDGLVLATGNDFRAVEAAGHAFAARDGKYRALSRVFLEQGLFSLELDIPLALGTVGGLTRLHPLAEKTLDILGKPDARMLMKIAAAIGLANNFAAMASLVTTGIQQGHMKMHLQNIINSLNVDTRYHEKIHQYFSDKTVSVAAVREYAGSLKS